MIAETTLGSGQPSRTAWQVAMLRAAHQLLDEPLVLDDPLALAILGADAAAQLRDDPYPCNDPMLRGLRAGLVVRSRFAEEEAERGIADGVRQVVVLGAGLDTFAYRHGHEVDDLRLFEVDHPATQAWKRGLLAGAGIGVPANLTYVASDFEHVTLAQALAAAGFDATQPACFSWLGVTMYLTEAAIVETLRFVAALPSPSSICFDFQAAPAQLNPVERVIVEGIVERMAASGEPWLSLFDPEKLGEMVRALGFGAVRMIGADEMNRLYLSRRKDGLHCRCQMVSATV